MINLYYTSLVYLCFVVGGVIPVLAEGDEYVAVRGMFFFLVWIGLALPFRGKRALVLFAAKYILLSACVLVPLVLNSTDVFYALQKIESIVLAVAIAFALIAFSVERYGWTSFYLGMVKVAMVVLLLTLAYKTVFGFWQREVRFFLNGPIVFGWLMGLHGVISMILWDRTAQVRHAFFAVCFFSAVVWTQSKGPLLASIVAIAYLVFLSRGKSNLRLRAIALLAVLSALVFLFQEQVLESLEGSRLQAIANVITGDVQENDEGSIGSRADMIDEVAKFTSDSLFLGVGVGDWQFKSSSGLKYPHNQHLEILVEMGVGWFLLHLILLSVGFYFSDRYLRSIIVFFVVAGNFSGDASYLRYVYPFVLVGIGFYGLHIFRSSARRIDEGRGDPC